MLYLILFLIAPIYAGVLLPTKPSIDPFYNAPEGFKMLLLEISYNLEKLQNQSLVGLFRSMSKIHGNF